MECSPRVWTLESWLLVLSWKVVGSSMRKSAGWACETGAPLPVLSGSWSAEMSAGSLTLQLLQSLPVTELPDEHKTVLPQPQNLDLSSGREKGFIWLTVPGCSQFLWEVKAATTWSS